MAADVDLGPPLALGETRILFGLDAPAYSGSWDVAPDGDLFLVNVVLEDRSRGPIQVVLNWRPSATASGR